MKHLLFVSPDTITETLLAAGLLQTLADRFPGLTATVVCPEGLRYFYQHAPFVKAILPWRPDQAQADPAYRDALATQIAAIDADTCIHARTQRDPLSDALALNSSAPEIIAHDSLTTPPLPPPPAGGRTFTRLVPRPDVTLLECQHHRNLLHVLGIEVELVMPQVWTSQQDQQAARDLLVQLQFEPGKTLVFLSNPLHQLAIYSRFAEAFRPLCADLGMRVLMLGDPPVVAPPRGEAEGLQALPLVDLRGRVPLGVAAEILRLVPVAVGLEGALAHVACAVGCRNVVLLAGGTFGAYLPYSPLTAGITIPIHCVGCQWQCVHSFPYCSIHIMPEIIEGVVRHTLAGIGEFPRIFIQAMAFAMIPIDFPFYLNPDRLPPILMEFIVVLPSEMGPFDAPPSRVGCPITSISVSRRYSAIMKVLGHEGGGIAVSFGRSGSA